MNWLDIGPVVLLAVALVGGLVLVGGLLHELRDNRRQIAMLRGDLQRERDRECPSCRWWETEGVKLCHSCRRRELFGSEDCVVCKRREADSLN